MKILLLDHAFHRSTGSSSFFVDLLRRRFEVDHQYLDPEVVDACPSLHGDLDHDLVLLWQFDFLAPIFLARGMRTVVVPMYDGSANMPKAHWQAARGARFVNFSRTLHERVLAAGAASMHVRYYPEAAAEKDLPDFNDLRAFFWQRRPQDIAWTTVHEMLGSRLRLLHIHNAPDLPRQAVAVDRSRFGGASYLLTESTWFDNRARYFERLRQCNVYVAPRVSEGIGFGFLEAMAQGMLVLASDEPTHTEYIANWVNGILFNPRAAGPVEVGNEHARRMALLGWRSVRLGREQWLADCDSMLTWIAETPRPMPVRAPQVAAAPAFVSSLCSSYLAGGTAYTSFLARHLSEGTGDSELSNELVEVEQTTGHGYSGPFVDDQVDGLVFGPGAPSVRLVDGFGLPDSYSAPIVAARARCEFALRKGIAGSTITVLGDSNVDRPALLVFSLSGVALRVLRLEPGVRALKFELPLARRLQGPCLLDIQLLDPQTLEPPASFAEGAVRLRRVSHALASAATP